MQPLRASHLSEPERQLLVELRSLAHTIASRVMATAPDDLQVCIDRGVTEAMYLLAHALETAPSLRRPMEQYLRESVRTLCTH